MQVMTNNEKRDHEMEEIKEGIQEDMDEEKKRNDLIRL